MINVEAHAAHCRAASTIIVFKKHAQNGDFQRGSLIKARVQNETENQGQPKTGNTHARAKLHCVPILPNQYTDRWPGAPACTMRALSKKKHRGNIERYSKPLLGEPNCQEGLSTPCCAVCYILFNVSTRIFSMPSLCKGGGPSHPRIILLRLTLSSTF